MDATSNVPVFNYTDGHVCMCKLYLMTVICLVNKSLSPGELVDLVSVDTDALSRSQPEHIS